MGTYTYTTYYTTTTSNSTLQFDNTIQPVYYSSAWDRPMSQDGYYHRYEPTKQEEHDYTVELI